MSNSSGFPPSHYLHFIFLVLLFAGSALSSAVVKTLPGYDGELPFTLETGYIGVGDSEDVQLFYYFVESQRSPAQDPVLLWLTGGPGCSTLLAFFYESGPLAFTYSDYNGSLPSLHVNPYTWTKGLNIIYVDAPVGTGFSYSNTSEGYYSGDIESAVLTYEFLRKWMVEHPGFKSNQLYIGGDSYSGITVPLIIQEILEGNDVKDNPRMNLKGYVLGNPKTDTFLDTNARIPYAYHLGLIPKELYETANESCNGDFVNVDSTNEECETALQTIEVLILEINMQQVLEPSCSMTSREPSSLKRNRRSLREQYKSLLLSQPEGPAFWCRNYQLVLCGIWANDKTVREALQIREETKSKWKMCNSSLSYTQELSSVINYHRNFTQADLRALIYSGDHDMSIPHTATRGWIRSFNMTLMDAWRPWYVDAQVAGYTEEYSENDYVLTFATIKGAGHIAAVYKQKQSAAMLDRWFAYYPL
ncbi:serine carboxypeptidase-like 13 [Alnus glutinosa]|uniref:serine carboxypeptidase-like 13 n=1 Tax=Alnus glutinosa TaxID=3517 RepID=UPI002D7877B9|nr:serine carboxypeptidase-like 13 [Alnus glutinosa]